MENNAYASSVVEVNNHSTLKIKFDCGLNDQGKTITKTRSFSGVKHNATSENVYVVAQTLASLQENTLLEVVKQDNTELSI